MVPALGEFESFAVHLMGALGPVGPSRNLILDGACHRIAAASGLELTASKTDQVGLILDRVILRMS